MQFEIKFSFMASSVFLFCFVKVSVARATKNTKTTDSGKHK